MLLEETAGKMDTITDFLCWMKIKREGRDSNGYGVLSFHNKPSKTFNAHYSSNHLKFSGPT